MADADAERMDHETYHRMEDMFAEGYRAAQDKLAYLRLAHIPFEMPVDPDSDSDTRMHLIGVQIDEVFEVGSVTPAFGTNRLMHQMYPDQLVKCRTSLRFRYVHRGGAAEKSLRELFGLVIEDADHHH